MVICKLILLFSKFDLIIVRSEFINYTTQFNRPGKVLALIGSDGNSFFQITLYDKLATKFAREQMKYSESIVSEILLFYNYKFIL